MIKIIVAAPLLLAATQSFALYCGSDSNQNHINAGRATLKYTLLAYANGSNAYLGMNSGTEMIQETSAGHYQITTSCSGDTGQTTQFTPVGPNKTIAKNAENELDRLTEFSGKNYNVIIAGSDLVEDTGGDQQADKLQLPRTVYVDIPEGATVEAAWVSYYGSAFLTSDGGQDDTDDLKNGGIARLDTEDDIKNNEINITVGNNDLGALTPSSTKVGPQSRTKISWWKMQSPYGTMAYGRAALYNNRLDLTNEFVGLKGNIPVRVTRLQRADFAGKSNNSRGSYNPEGPNDNNEWANDCLGNASYSVMVVYSMPQGEDKTITVYDGMSWAWNNDFATDLIKASNPVPHPLSLDINIEHEAIDATTDLNIYLGAIDGDKYGHSGVMQCQGSGYKHQTGHDHTWVKSGNAQENYYADIYEGLHAPEVGTSFDQYPAVSSVVNGLNFNIVKINVENPEDESTNTLIHVEGDSPNSTDIPQEAMLIGFVVVEAKTKAQSTNFEPTITAPVVTMNGDTEMNLEFGVTFTDPGATATDAEDGALTPVADCNVTTSVAGTYTCAYTATDSKGLSDTKTRTVIVAEDNSQSTNTPPEITLNGAVTVNLEFGAAWTDLGATATDAEDETINPVTDCPVNTSVAGTYTCTYTATDSGALSDTATRTVVVAEEVINTCVDYTGTYQQHADAGRVEIKYYSNFYIIGSGEYLGSTYVGGTATLIETAPGKFSKGSCN